MAFSPWADGGPTPDARKTRKAAAARRAAKTVQKTAPKIWQAARSAPAPRRQYTPPAPRVTSRTTSVPRPANSYAPARSNTGRISANAGPAPTPAPPPAPPTVEQWLAGDTGYLSTTDAIQKALADYQARMNQQKGQYETEYNTNLGNLNTSREAAIADLTDDFAARGLMNSGLFANSRSELMSDYDARQAALEQGKSNFLADLEAALADFTSEQELIKTKAKQDAINRRAQKYGIG